MQWLSITAILICWGFGAPKAVAQCEVSIYTVVRDDDGTWIYCSPRALVRTVNVVANGCVDTSFDNSYDLGAVFTTINDGCIGGMYMIPTGASKSPVFQANCSNAVGRILTVDPNYTDVCMVPVPVPDHGNPGSNIGGVVCLCNGASAWSTTSTAHFTNPAYPTTVAEDSGYVTAFIPDEWVSSVEAVSAEAATTKASSSSTATDPTSTTPTSSSTSASTTSNSDSDPATALQKTSNKIALGVGIGIGLPALLVAVIGLCMRRRH